MKIFLVISVCVCSFVSFSQDIEEDPRVYFQIGVGGGRPFIQQVEEQPYAADIYTGFRKTNFYFRIGAAFELTDRDRLDLVFQPNAFQIDKKDVKNAYLTRLPGYYIYHDFNVDNTNSTGNGHSLYNIDLQYSHEIPAGKMTILPYCGVGIGFWNHRDYRYVLRAHNSNDFSTYRFELKTKASFSYSTGIRFTWRRLANNEIDISFIGNYANLNYDIQITPGDPAILPYNEQLGFNRFVHAIRIGIIGLGKDLQVQ